MKQNILDFLPPLFFGLAIIIALYLTYNVGYKQAEFDMAVDIIINTLEEYKSDSTNVGL